MPYRMRPIVNLINVKERLQVYGLLHKKMGGVFRYVTVTVKLKQTLYKSC